MKRNWTDDQKKTIETRNRSLLISAAAGSGKTAVLVERIIQKITDPVNPVDVDSLLVVTFTRAAAAEMKERIRKALAELVDSHPEDARLKNQYALVPYAQITTIDSFCKRVVSDHFQEVENLNPGFRQLPEDESFLMQQEIVGKILQETYEEPTEGFEELIAGFSDFRGDKKIMEMILEMKRFACSYPYPEEWLDFCKQFYGVTDAEHLMELPFIREYGENVLADIDYTIEGVKELIRFCNENPVPEKYLPVYQTDLDNLVQFKEKAVSMNLVELMDSVKGFSFARKPTIRGRDSSTEAGMAMDTVDAMRQKVKKYLKKSEVSFDPEECLEQIKIMRPYALCLIELTKTFIEEFQRMKLEKGVLEFSDLSHYALQILVADHVKGTLDFTPSKVALQMQESVSEVMIDEYQDSNLIQEMILLAVSGEKTGNPNYFMVGDVKQSIYRFRMARPKLFMEKYDSFSKEESDHQKIELSKNFRSRNCVVESVNECFEMLMKREVGGIDYNDDCKLYLGAAYPEYPHKDMEEPDTEVMVLKLLGEERSLSAAEETETESESESEDTEDELSTEVATSTELEARMISEKILELTGKKGGNPLLVYDGDSNSYRPCEFRDIMICMRAVSSRGDIYTETMKEYGIPAISDSKEGYMNSYEIRLLLNMLKIIDNPHQDIPLLAVLHSALIGINSEELAMIRIYGLNVLKNDDQSKKSHDFYDLLTIFAQKAESDTAMRCREFLDALDNYRRLAKMVTIYDLLKKIMEDYRYEIFISLLPEGEARRLNIEYLLKKTLEFEKSSFTGLFQFIRFVEQMKRYSVDISASEKASVQDGNYVTILTIHKSKGLEYPVVFLANTGTQFNLRDLNSQMLLDEDKGMMIKCVDGKRKLEAKCSMKNIFRSVLLKETLGEELRLLYVAMTRAKEKLIITGTTKTDYCADEENFADKKPCVSEIREAKSYLEWIMEFARRNDSRFRITYTDSADIAIRHIESASSILNEEARMREILKAFEDPALLSEEAGKTFETVRETYEAKYAFEKELSLKANLSVSELKMAAHEWVEKMSLNDTEDTILEQPQEAPFLQQAGVETKKEPVLPKFIRQQDGEKDKVNGALRGSAVHAVMEHFDFSQDITPEFDWEGKLKEIEQKEAFPDDYRGLVRADYIEKFFESNLAKRMQKAEMNGKLYKEYSFILGLTPDEFEKAGYGYFTDETDADEFAEVPAGADTDGFVMIQGIIDGYFEENGKIILMDYKTDAVEENGGDRELIRRYYTQLFYYDIALSRMTGKEVSEWWIYSFRLGRAIPVRIK